MIMETVRVYQAEGYELICNPFNASKKDMAGILWVFYVSKILDFLDTVFMILRGKWEQMSFLHVYHHITIFLVTAWRRTHAGAVEEGGGTKATCHRFWPCVLRQPSSHLCGGANAHLSRVCGCPTKYYGRAVLTFRQP